MKKLLVIMLLLIPVLVWGAIAIKGHATGGVGYGVVATVNYKLP